MPLDLETLQRQSGFLVRIQPIHDGDLGRGVSVSRPYRPHQREWPRYAGGIEINNQGGPP